MLAGSERLNRLTLMYILVSLLLIVLVVGALVDIITRPDGQVKHLPKTVWVLLVVLLPMIGSIVWFVAGREYTAPVPLGSFGDPRRRAAAAPSTAQRPLTTEEELAALDREIAFHEKQDRIARLEAEVEARRKLG